MKELVIKRTFQIVEFEPVTFEATFERRTKEGSYGEYDSDFIERAFNEFSLVLIRAGITRDPINWTGNDKPSDGTLPLASTGIHGRRGSNASEIEPISDWSQLPKQIKVQDVSYSDILDEAQIDEAIRENYPPDPICLQAKCDLTIQGGHQCIRPENDK